MKFIHLADLHLDQPFEGLGKLPARLLAELVGQHEKMIKQVVQQAITENVDFVLIVGDTFHHSAVTIQTQQLLINAMARLKRHQIPVIMSFGNHDYYVPDNYWFDFPENVTLLKEQSVTTHHLTTKQQEKVAISGFSYEDRWINESKISEFPTRDHQATYHIGLYHGQQGKTDSTQQYAPFTLGEMKAKGYDYWALGHIHQPTVLSNDPLMIYPGSPLGHTKKEASSAGVLVVETGADGWHYHWKSLNQVVWSTETFELSQVTSTKSLLQELLNMLRERAQQSVIKLTSIVLLGSNAELEEPLDTELRSGGLLTYLQAELGQEDQLVWPFEIKRRLDEDTMELPLGVTRELISQLSQRYLTEVDFNELMGDIHRQADLSRLVEINEELRQELVTDAEELLVRELGGGKNDH
ncbi:DNA repair exonuclease [Vagococcus sp. BWB3-3]|uniref:DNA repair exonuclease n=1 Tax=Vagococcus allomyrinae TaxID=2794353 RepID=A0A940P1Q5_9ENTE|nr:DNA repair exonuclease [Vagococcus allomyrinae]